MPRNRGGRSNRVRLVEDVKPTFHQRWGVQLALALWRWLPEIAFAVGVVTAFIYLTRMDLPPWAAACVMVAPVTLGLSVPQSRTVLLALFWVDVTRHRLRAFMAENGLRNHSGRLPWLLAVYPTRIGERAWMVLVAGISSSDVEERLRSLGSTCYAREGRVEAHKKFAHLVRIDIIRRDPLAAKGPVPSQLLKANAEQEVIPAPAVDSYSTNKASRWAIGIGLPLSNDRDSTTPSAADIEAISAIQKKAAAPKKTTPSAPRTEPAERTVRSASGEDISDYV